MFAPCWAKVLLCKQLLAPRCERILQDCTARSEGVLLKNDDSGTEKETIRMRTAGRERNVAEFMQSHAYTVIRPSVLATCTLRKMTWRDHVCNICAACMKISTQTPVFHQLMTAISGIQV